MNSPKLAVERLEEIIKATHRELPLAERCALYAAARYLLDDLRQHATPEVGRIDGYISEKIQKSKWHIGAALGFDIDNGHDDQQHRSSAYGQLSTLRNLFAERFPDDE